MSARKARGNVTTAGASPAWGRSAATQGRAAAVDAANHNRQACAARARAQAPASQRGVLSACRLLPFSPQAFAPCGSFSPASQTTPANHGRQPSKRASDLFSNHGGLTMAKPAPSFFYDTLKSVPLGGFAQPATENSKCACKPLKLRNYTLCEVDQRRWKPFPMV